MYGISEKNLYQMIMIGGTNIMLPTKILQPNANRTQTDSYDPSFFSPFAGVGSSTELIVATIGATAGAGVVAFP